MASLEDGQSYTIGIANNAFNATNPGLGVFDVGSVKTLKLVTSTGANALGAEPKPGNTVTYQSHRCPNQSAHLRQGYKVLNANLSTSKRCFSFFLYLTCFYLEFVLSFLSLLVWVLLLLSGLYHSENALQLNPSGADFYRITLIPQGSDEVNF